MPGDAEQQLFLATVELAGSHSRLMDIEQERNGLLDVDRKPKLPSRRSGKSSPDPPRRRGAEEVDASKSVARHRLHT